jgi:hypothetical protein
LDRQGLEGDLTADVFSGLVHLQYLSLQENTLESIGPNTFSACVALE